MHTIATLNQLCETNQKLAQKIKAQEVSIKEFSYEHSRELSSPYMKNANGEKSEFFNARVNLFIKALDLHREAIHANARKFGSNLRFLRDMFNGDLDPKFTVEHRLEIFKTLFFVVPVLSSIFASFRSCFKDFGSEDIGYLLIDESGQAALPNAVGALFRSKRAVVVGDPLQLEPVVTLPTDLNEILLKVCDCEDEFNLANTSVQVRADRVTQNGTYLGVEKIWVGSPLRVHNRCNNPMFKISNITTYDEMMILGKKEKFSYESKGLKSEWIDVASQNFAGNFSYDEAEALKELLATKLNGVDKKDIKIISPFRDAVKALESYDAGTVHTMQGQEAKIVVIVLGGASAGDKNGHQVSQICSMSH
ncbi:DEAD/DEAH box helicase [Campylobacter hyointestinalis]|uniref:DEAD/DEAH box helicase n=1 Tax=Campylobacter hyointestinalis TaxID=198 RepID=UPI0011AD6E28|nr:AAA domain-containing protein [Campylobacter hyointestinalis]TWO20026.1 hypothetical protein YZ80_06390 [Campylobacter hyointestinalis]